METRSSPSSSEAAAAAAASNRAQFERCDSYEDQLRTLFISCDPRGTESLDENDLDSLCRKLELPRAQSQSLILELLAVNPASDYVTFDVFKAGLVTFLERLNCPQAVAEEDVVEPEPDPVVEASSPSPRSRREVEPKVVIKNKKYGRKSRPSSVELSDSEVEEVDKEERLQQQQQQRQEQQQQQVRRFFSNLCYIKYISNEAEREIKNRRKGLSIGKIEIHAQPVLTFVMITIKMTKFSS